MYIFEKIYIIFRHLKLEIALAIPASNDEKYNWNNSAGQGLKFNFHMMIFDNNNISKKIS